MLSVLFEDNHLLVVDKPAGLLVQGGDVASADRDDHLVARAAAWLKARHGKPGNVYVGLVHRLDRNTSGVVVLAKTSKAAERLAKAFAGRDVDKRYLAVASGHTPAALVLEHWLTASDDGGSRVVPAPRDGATAAEPGQKRARLTLETRATSRGGDPFAASLVAVRLESGRKHQIRVQLAAVGHALLGDRRYAPPEVASRFPRPALHAASITLEHPVRREPVTFAAPLPADFAALVRAFGWTVTGVLKNEG